MEDMGWCPLEGCGQIANIDKALNRGKCSFCEFQFCLECKERVHPFKRCPLNRIDLRPDLLGMDQVAQILKKNNQSE
jgi:hypothetical protein